MKRMMTVVLVLALAACGGDAKVAVTMGNGETGPVLNEGDVQVTSTDGALILSVAGDSVFMQLSDSLRESVRSEVAQKTTPRSEGVGGAIEKLVGGAVGAAVKAAMGFTVRVPADAIEHLRYEDGNLRFDVKGSNIHMSSKGGDTGNSDNGGAFLEEDATRFIQAVNDAQARILQRPPR